MCRFKSGIITKQGVTLAPMYNDSHSALLKAINIEDTVENAMRKFVRAELTPPNNDKTADIEKWNYKADQDIVPSWYEEDPGRYEDEMRKAVKSWIEKRFINICGKTCMRIKEDEKGVYYMLAEPLMKLKFGDDNNYSTSLVREKLQECDFANSLRQEFGDSVVNITTDLLSMDGLDDYGLVEGDTLALMTLDLYRECRKNILNINTWEWLATPYSTPTGCSSNGVCCVSARGYVGYFWYGNVRAVRPFFILKS